MKSPIKEKRKGIKRPNGSQIAIVVLAAVFVVGSLTIQLLGVTRNAAPLLTEVVTVPVIITATSSPPQPTRTPLPPPSPIVFTPTAEPLCREAGTDYPLVAEFAHFVVAGAKWMPDGHTLAVYATDSVTFYDMFRPDDPPFGTALEASRGTIAFSPSGSLMAYSDTENAIRVVNPRMGRQEGAPKLGHFNAIKMLAFSPDGDFIVSGGEDGTARLWYLFSDKEEATIAGLAPITTLAFSPDDIFLVIGTDDKQLGAWNVQSMLDYNQVEPFDKQYDMGVQPATVSALAFTADSQILAYGMANGRIELYGMYEYMNAGAMLGHTGRVNGLDFSPDGKHLASAGADGTIRIWRIGETVEETILRGLGGPALSVDYNPAGTCLVATDTSGKIWVWGVPRG